MSVINKALREIAATIPEQILEETFNPPSRYDGYRAPINYEVGLREKVFYGRLIEDLNLTGGHEVTIPLVSLQPQYADEFRVIYEIPDRLTNNRDIIQPLNVTFGEGTIMGTTNMGMRGHSPMLDAASGILSSHLPIPLVSTAYVRLVGRNVICVEDNMALPRNIFLRAIVAYDAEFSSLNPRSWHRFTKGAKLATKAYIYNHLEILIDEGEIRGGFSIGAFKNIVERYADAEEMYQEFLQKEWKVTSVLGDYEQKKRSLKHLMASGR